jgi:hypothetical protein
MKSEISINTQCNYTLTILEQEYQHILSQHPLDISVDGFNWMMLGMTRVNDCLKSMQNNDSYETILSLWHHHCKTIEKFTAIRKIAMSPEFTTSKAAIETAVKELLEKKSN